MVHKQSHAIRFLLPWRGREPGQVDTQLGYGVMDSLVQSHRAEWVETEQADKRRKRQGNKQRGTSRSVHH